MSAWGCKTYNFDVASSSAGWVFASVVEVTAVWVSASWASCSPDKTLQKLFYLLVWYIYIFFSPDGNGDSSDTQPIHCLQCLYSYGLYTDRCWLVKTSNTPTKWEEMWPKKHVTKNLQVSVKKKNKTKTRQKMAKVLLVWLNLTFINFIKILKKTLSKCNI